MNLSQEEEFDALVTLTAALISRSPSLPSQQQTVEDAWGYLNLIAKRVYENHTEDL